MYKDLKFTMSTTVTVEDYDNAVALLAQYNLSWEEFAQAVHAGIQAEVFGTNPQGQDTMYIYSVGKGYFFDSKIESAVYEEVAEIRFEINQPQSVKVDDVKG